MTRGNKFAKLRLAKTWAMGGVFKPTSISGLKLWLDFSDVSTLYQDDSKSTAVSADGDPIGAAEDQSGNGNDATQGTDADRPTYKTGIQNSKSIARFDGTSDYLLVNSIAGLMSGSDKPLTVYTVWKSTTDNSPNHIMSWGSSSEDDHYFSHQTSSSDEFGTTKRVDATNKVLVSTETHGTTSFWVDGVVVPGTTASRYANGSVLTNIDGGDLDTPTASIDQCTVGAFPRTSISNFWSGDIAEVIVYNSAISAANRSSLETYLNDKWAVY